MMWEAHDDTQGERGFPVGERRARRAWIHHRALIGVTMGALDEVVSYALLSAVTPAHVRFAMLV